METARAQTELARAQVAQQEALLTQTRALQGFTQVTTPVGGVVLKRHVHFLLYSSGGFPLTQNSSISKGISWGEKNLDEQPVNSR